MRIYVASSWRNIVQPSVVVALRRCGHEVYDFRHPAPGVSGFSWSEIDPEWQKWTPAQYREALQHPIAKRGYGYDVEALRGCDACVLVLPSGRSASWEFGYAMGQGKRGAVFSLDPCEPELMYREAEILVSFDELLTAFGFRDGAMSGRGELPCPVCTHADVATEAVRRGRSLQDVLALAFVGGVSAGIYAEKLVRADICDRHREELERAECEIVAALPEIEMGATRG